jgi:type IV secretory pathway VirB2 component (pilin)
VLDPVAGARPPARSSRSRLRRAYDLLTSPKLALALLVVVLACCVAGVTMWRGEQAWRLVFSTLWFNALLVLLAVSSAAAFVTRVGRRKLTLVSAGMIVFHVSFAALLGGVVWNSLFHFNGLLRLTEGETLPNGHLESYDKVEAGRLFDPARLRGDTTLVRMHNRYEVDGMDKRAAYDVEVGEEETKTSGTIYVTRHLEHEGIRYLRSKEGFSVLVVLSDEDGKDVYGAFVPLQSHRQEWGGYHYMTGTATEARPFPFPPPPEQPRAHLVVSYRPDKETGRAGDVGLQFVPVDASGNLGAERTATARVGEVLDAGEFKLSVREVRYWVGMDVRYDPGLNVILGSLCTGLAGMVLTFIGRVRQGSRRSHPTGTAGGESAVNGASVEVA